MRSASIKKMNHIFWSVLVCTGFWQTSAVAQVEYTLGYAALEEGDERLRPAYAFHAGLTPNYFFRSYFWGRDYGPVKERGMLLSFNHRYGIFNSRALQANLGVAILNERVELDFEGSEDDESEQSGNLGAAVGLQYGMKITNRFIVHAAWDSHLFLAGQGGIFLVTGRKQTISMTAGVAF